MSGLAVRFSLLGRAAGGGLKPVAWPDMTRSPAFMPGLPDPASPYASESDARREAALDECTAVVER
jgi:hypothetical protein